MHPILTRFGPFFLYSYSVVMALALAAGIGLTAWLTRKNAREDGAWIDALLFVLVGGLIGGRIAFVWANSTYFHEQPEEIIRIWNGGLNYHGGLLAGLLALWVWTTWQRRSFGDYAGLLALAFALASTLGWLACYLDGCAFGKETGFSFWSADLPDSYGVPGLRFQTQLIGLGLSLATFLLVMSLWRKVRPTTLFLITLLFLSAGRLVITFLRGDKAPILAGIRLDTLLESFLVTICLFALALPILYCRIMQRHKTNRQ